MELKPCPFCGHTPIIEKKKSRIQGVFIFSLRCECGANIGARRDESEFVKEWNTRPEQNKLLAENEMLKLHNKMHVDNITRGKNNILKLIAAVKELIDKSMLPLQVSSVYEAKVVREFFEQKEKLKSIISEIEEE